MKHFYLLISLGFFAFVAKAENVNIPDANFKAYLLANTAINTDADPGNISMQEAAGFNGKMDVSNKSIGSLAGIEAFVNLKSLDCSSNQLTSLDVSINTVLSYLKCTGNAGLKIICVRISNVDSGDYTKDASAYWSGTCGLSGIEDVVSNNTETGIYPNPAADYIHIEKGSSVVIYNSFGQVVLKEEKAFIDISTLPSGLYTVSVTGIIKGNISNYKLVKK